jgi:Zn-dependent protease with chaperone function
MLFESVIGFFSNPLHLTVLIFSWALALISFLYWREHPQARFLYAHLFFLLVPLLDFAVAVPCSVPFLQGLQTFCSVVITRTVIFVIPFALLFAGILGLKVFPALYKRRYDAKQLSNARFSRLAEKAGLSGARFWLLDTARPLAFSFGNDVLISVGMFELLNRREQDAVFLHELGHLKHKSSLGTFAVRLARLFSPIAHFASLQEHICAEEIFADDFAIKTQGASRHLFSARKKLQEHSSVKFI